MANSRNLPLFVAAAFGIGAALLDVMNIRMVEPDVLLWAGTRYGLIYLGALMVGLLGGSASFLSWIVLTLPTAVVVHGFLLSDMSGDAGLWPPLLTADVILMIVCLPLILVGRRIRSRQVG